MGSRCGSLRRKPRRRYGSRIGLNRQDLLVIKMDSGAAAGLPPEIAAAIAAGKVDPALVAKFAAASGNGASGPAPGLSFVKPEVSPGEPLRLEITSFLDSVRTRRSPRVTARQGREALALALQIQTTMAAHAERAGLADFFSAGQ